MPIDAVVNEGTEFFLPKDNGLQLIRAAVRSVNKGWLNNIDPSQGCIRVISPGPTLDYTRTDEGYRVVVTNTGGGNAQLAQTNTDALVRYLSSYATPNSEAGK